MFVYLLHFDARVGNAFHYMGSCEDNRLDARMREHQTGNGSSLTKRAVNQGTGFTLAGLWKTPDRTEEKRRKTRGHFRSRMFSISPLFHFHTRKVYCPGRARPGASINPMKKGDLQCRAPFVHFSLARDVILRRTVSCQERRSGPGGHQPQMPFVDMPELHQSA